MVYFAGRFEQHIFLYLTSCCICCFGAFTGRTFLNASLYSPSPPLSHSQLKPSAMAVARVTRPAPDFTAEALLNGSDFGTVKLSDYKGKVRVRPRGEQGRRGGAQRAYAPTRAAAAGR